MKTCLPTAVPLGNVIFAVPDLVVDDHVQAAEGASAWTESKPNVLGVAGSKVADSNTLDGVDSLGFAGSQIYVREMVTNGSANVQGTCPDGDLCFAGGYYCDLGDTLLGGGFADIDNGTRLVASEPFVPNTQDAWRVKFVNNSTEDTITVCTICADNGAAHGGH